LSRGAYPQIGFKAVWAMRLSGPACGPVGRQLWLALDAFAERGGEPSRLALPVCRWRRGVLIKEAPKRSYNGHCFCLRGRRAADFYLGWLLRHQA